MKLFNEFLNFFSEEEDNKNHFLTDHKDFLRLHPINAFQLGLKTYKDLNDPDSIYSFKLSNGKHAERVLAFANEKKGGPGTFEGYYLDYNPNSYAKSGVASLTIPKENPLANYVFTGGLTGCLVIVEDNGDNYKLYHDHRTDQIQYSELIAEYENPVAVFGKSEEVDYLSKENKIVPLGFAALVYDKDSGWSLFGQALTRETWDKESEIQPVAFNENKSLVEKKLPRINNVSDNSNRDFIGVPIEHLGKSMSKMFNEDRDSNGDNSQKSLEKTKTNSCKVQ